MNRTAASTDASYRDKTIKIAALRKLMGHTDHLTLPAGRVAARWFLFLVFFHLLPVPWFMFVAAGLAPASFLFAAGVAGLFNTDFDSLTMAIMFLVPALISGLVFVLLAYLLAAGIGRLKKPLAITFILIIILAICIGVALNPVYISGGHGSSHQFSLLGFLDILGQFQIPMAASVSYFIGLTLLLVFLLIYQHTPHSFPSLLLSRDRRRRLLRRSMVCGLIVFIALFCWMHRALFFLKPLADMGLAGAQYHLALSLQKKSGSEVSSGASSRHYLERAAEQGHIKAAMILARSPRNAEDKMRWLTVAADGGLAEAHYELYRYMMKSAVADYKSRSAIDWLQSAAERGLADAQYELGRLQIHGNQQRGIEKNIQKARQWWEKAADSGHGQSMIELAWRYTQAAEGFPGDPARATVLLEKIADGYRYGRYGLPENQQMALRHQKQAEEIKALEERAAKGDPEALVFIGRLLLRSQTTNTKGVALLEKAATQGDSRIQYELGDIYLSGRHGITPDLEKGRKWWDLALAQKHVKTMEMVAPAYQNGRFGYSVDLLKSKALVELLVEAYRDGRYGVDPDAKRERHWTSQLKYIDQLFDMAGGSYLPLDDLRQQAADGDLQAQYQLGRQMLVAGSAGERQKGLHWIERSAEGGYAEAQYRLVIYYENKIHIMRDNPSRGVALLQAAAKQNHLHAMSTLALAYEKGRYRLAKDYRQSQMWYQKLLQAYDSGQYIGDVDDQFISFQRRYLEYVSQARQYQEDRARRYEQATALERQIMKIEDRYRTEYQKAVNSLNRGDGSREGQKQFRARVEQLRQEYDRQKKLEIAKIKQ
ncbi:MAG: tetratricopeptide repeat protein [Desulfobacterales bacterium]